MYCYMNTFCVLRILLREFHSKRTVGLDGLGIAVIVDTIEEGFKANGSERVFIPQMENALFLFLAPRPVMLLTLFIRSIQKALFVCRHLHTSYIYVAI